MNRVFPNKLILFVLFYVTTFPSVHAGSLFVGYSQSEQNTLVSNRNLAFSPSGTSVLLSFDITEDWALSFDYAKLTDNKSVANSISGELDINVWGAGLSYYLNDWSFSASYSDWQDDLLIYRDRNQLLSEQSTRSPSASLSISYDWFIHNWQIGVSSGLHNSDWQQNRVTSVQTNPATSTFDEGTSNFISLGLSTARIISFENAHDVIIGGSLAWNYLTNAESNAVTRNGRNIGRVTNRTGRSVSASSGITGTESYGQLNIYVSYNISKSISVDFDSTFDIADEETTQSWSVNLGYIF